MKIKFDEEIIELAASLPKPLYAVGGSVRNAFLGGEETDVDLASANGEEELVGTLGGAGMSVSAVYKRTGTVMFVGRSGRHYEHTRFRGERYAAGGGHTPQATFFTDDIAEDACRRDFRCNALYCDVQTGELVDPLGGAADIAARVLDTVTAPEKVFKSDGLRLMRLCRFSGELGFAPTEEVLASAQKYADNIKDISPERIYDELKKMLQADGRYSFSPPDGHYRALKICERIGVLKIIMPELALGKNMPQRADFHKYDVLEHSLRTVLYADKSVRLAALLHDVGKPYAYLTHGAYAAHAEDGARISEEILCRLKAPKAVAEEVSRLVGAHMLDLDLAMRETKVRRKICENIDIFGKLMLLKQADHSACKDDTGQAPTVAKWQKIYEKMQEDGTPFTVRQLKIDGGTLKSMGFCGKEIGETLNALHFMCLDDPKMNDGEKLRQAAQKALLRRGR